MAWFHLHPPRESDPLQESYHPHVFSVVPQMLRSPNLLKDVGSTKSLPNLSLQLHNKTQLICAVGHMQLGVIDVSLCIIKPTLITK